MSLMQKVFVQQFFRVNAGFFTLVIVLTFGFMGGAEHRALAGYFVSSWTAVFIPFFIWLVYLFKTVRYNYQCMQRPENSVVSNFVLLPFPIKAKELLAISVSQQSPAIGYGIFLLLVAMQAGRNQQAITIAAMVLFVIFLAGGSLSKILATGYDGVRVSFLKRMLDRRFIKHPLHVTIEWLFRTEPFLVSGTKIFSCILIVAVSRLYAFETYDPRLMTMGTIVAVAANYTVFRMLGEFELGHFAWIRALPFSNAWRFIHRMIILALVLSPEAIVLAAKMPLHFSVAQAASVIVFAFTFALLIYWLMFSPALSRGTASASVRFFYLTIATIVIVLFRMPLPLCSVVFAGVSWYLNRVYYFRAE